MEIKVKQVVKYLDETFHPEYQEDYDNSGFLLGDGEADFRGALVTLDVTDEVADEAIELGLNLVVSHHPMIFTGMKRITDRNASGRLIMKLLRHGIAVYAAHTNLDNLRDGVNGILAERLGLANCRILKPFASDSDLGAGMVGQLEQPLAWDDLLQRVKAVCGLPTVRYAGRQGTIGRVAICGGSGAFLIEEALAAGADAYLTADLKYHDFQRCTDRMLLADIGHYESEQFAKEIISRAISKKFSNFAVRIAKRQQSLVNYI